MILSNPNIWPVLLITWDIIWALTRENLSSLVWEQQRCRPACTSTQSDQPLCYLLYLDLQQVKFNFLASVCSWGDWFESHFVATRPIFSISKTFSVALMLRLDSATLDYRQTVATLTLEGFKVAYVRMEGKVNSE